MSFKALLDKKHPFYKSAETQCWLAKKNDEFVGRIMAIANKQYSDFTQSKTGFFGFFECIQDHEVSELLLKKAENWL